MQPTPDQRGPTSRPLRRMDSARTALNAWSRRAEPWNSPGPRNSLPCEMGSHPSPGAERRHRKAGSHCHVSSRFLEAVRRVRHAIDAGPVRLQRLGRRHRHAIWGDTPWRSTHLNDCGCTFGTSVRLVRGVVAELGEHLFEIGLAEASLMGRFGKRNRFWGHRSAEFRSCRGDLR